MIRVLSQPLLKFLFIFGHAGSSLLLADFSLVAGNRGYCLVGVRRLPQLWCTGLVAPWHVGS